MSGLTYCRWAFLLACLVFRLIAIDSDPPPWLSWSTGLYTDEGFYTLDARHVVLFGTLAPGTFHDRLLSPLLSMLQEGVFTVFGVGILQARLLSVGFGMLTLVVFWVGLRRAYGVKVADAGALFLGLAPPFLLYNRTALQETSTVFWLVLAFTLWTFGTTQNERRKALFYALAGSSVGAAVIFKSLAGLAIPVLFAGVEKKAHKALLSTGVDERAGVDGRAGASPAPTGFCLASQNWGAGAFLLVLALYVGVWYIPHHAELSRMTTYYRVHQIQPHSWVGLWLNIRRGLVKGELGVVPYLLATLPVPCLLAGWGVLRRREWSGADRFLAYWLAGGLLFCLLSSYAPSRYYVLFLPALMGLAARQLGVLKRPGQIAAVCVFLVTSMLWLGAAWLERSFAQREARQELTRTLPIGSVVIGDFAPTLCLGTPFASTTVQPGLANDDHPVERLKATHVLVVRNAANWQTWWRGHYPDVMQPSHKLTSFEFGGSRHFIVDLYTVKALK